MSVEKKNHNKYLVIATKELENLKVKDINFLFPIENYSVGFKDTYKIKEIKQENAFIYLNRIFDNESIETLRCELQNLPANIKGIAFNDLGVITLVKELQLNLMLIYMNNHNTTNKESINYYLDEVDSLLISTDITEEEINLILDTAKKPLVLPYFGLTEIMHSRRTLLKNFQKEFQLPFEQEKVVHEKISHNNFRIIENEYGTVFYQDKFLDYRSINHPNILFYLINGLNLTEETLKKVIAGEKQENSEKAFLERKTYYRLKEGE